MTQQSFLHEKLRERSFNSNPNVPAYMPLYELLFSLHGAYQVPQYTQLHFKGYHFS